MDSLGWTAFPRLAYAITTLCIDLVQISDGVPALCDRVSSRVPIIHTPINILHVVRDFHELVIELVLLDLEAAWVSAGQ